MRFVSTRDAQHAVTLSAALQAGIAPDGGLYVPERFPHLAAAQFAGATSLPEVAERLSLIHI